MTVLKFPLTDAQVDDVLHDIGRHLGVRYDEHGDAREPAPSAPVVSTGESLRLLEQEAREHVRRRIALAKLKAHATRGPR